LGNGVVASGFTVVVPAGTSVTTCTITAGTLTSGYVARAGDWLQIGSTGSVYQVVADPATGNGATVEITGISSIGFNSAIVGLSVNYPTGRTLKSIGVQSNSFTYVQAVTNTPVPNGNKQTLNVNVNLSNLSPNQNYLVKPFADISAGESNYSSNLNIKFLL
jgi:hypothetical protein